jgi:hypothetical protein
LAGWAEYGCASHSASSSRTPPAGSPANNAPKTATGSAATFPPPFHRRQTRPQHHRRPTRRDHRPTLDATRPRPHLKNTRTPQPARAATTAASLLNVYKPAAGAIQSVQA